MKCSINNKQAQKNANYEKGTKDAVYSMIVIVAYVLCRYGYKGRRIQQLMHSIQDVADSINKGYCTHKDLEDTLLAEYDIQLYDSSRGG